MGILGKLSTTICVLEFYTGLLKDFNEMILGMVSRFYKLLCSTWFLCGPTIYQFLKNKRVDFSWKLLWF